MPKYGHRHDIDPKPELGDLKFIIINLMSENTQT